MDQLFESPPSIPAVKLTSLAQQPLSAQRIEEPTRWILGLGEQQHRGNALLEETASNVSHKASPQT